jgi:[ribosomal protein S18]-alanine N-acetyltransferase
MAEYNCRLMQEADLNEVIDLVQSASEFAWSPQNIKESFLSKNDESFVLCSKSSNDVLAYAVIHNVLDESHLLNIVVKKKQQGMGLGSYFLRQLIVFIKEQKQQSLLLEVRASNAIAIKLYERLGFQHNGTRKAYYPSDIGREDARLYSLSLT